MSRSLKEVRCTYDTQHEQGLILRCPSGVLWENQAGGIACNHPQAEGIYIPLATYEDFPHVGCWAHVADSDYDLVQLAIDKAGWPLLVDRQVHGAEEGWWPVLLACTGQLAVLVTENCD